MPANRYQNRASVKKVATAPPKEEPKPDIDPKTGRPDWSRYNATVVGSRWNLSAPLHPAELPGVAAARERGLAAQAAYLATRKTYDYKNSEDGWTHVGRSKKRRSHKKLRIVEDEE
jgi:hypothetical protein